MHEIPADIGKNLTLETRPVRIVDRSEKAMRKKMVPMIKVVLDYNGEDLITWEMEERMKAEYLEWYIQFLPEETLNSDSRTNLMLVEETCHVPDPR